jgi:uncharacterized membrane-anchored protein
VKLSSDRGHTMGDVLTKSPARGGLGFGTVGSSAILGAVLVLLVGYVTLRKPAASAAASSATP